MPEQTDVEKAVERQTEQELSNVNVVKEIDRKRRERNEYDFDSSDEEDVRNTIGNIPLQWYSHFEHVGYDWDGKQIVKPPSADHIDDFLSKMKNPDYWRTVTDCQTGANVVLSAQELQLAKSLTSGKYPDPTVDPYADYDNWFSSQTMIHPMTNQVEHKRSFLPSKLERKKISRMVHSIKMGWMKPYDPKEDDRKAQYSDEEDEPEYHLLWDDAQNDHMFKFNRIAPPKLPPPDHSESYNPPDEYLLTEEEERVWKGKSKDERKKNYLPQKFTCLRDVPGYSDFIDERFQRCLDLYVNPREIKMRAALDSAADLLPPLPKPRDLEPYPKSTAIIYRGHTDLISCLSIHTSGQWLASSSMGKVDNSVRVWEVLTGRCIRCFRFDEPVRVVAWNPNPQLCLLAVAVGRDVKLINPHVGDDLVVSTTDSLLKQNISNVSIDEPKLKVDWRLVVERTSKGANADDAEDNDDAEMKRDRLNFVRVVVRHFQAVTSMAWHGKGDYLAVGMKDGLSQAVILHRLSQQRSQNPFVKSLGLLQQVLFHPVKPWLMVVGQKYIRIYDLASQRLVKKLTATTKWIAHVAVHHAGDHVMAAGFDCRLCWFDLDYSTKPYKTVKLHSEAVRDVAFHPRYPLVSTCGDDGVATVGHLAIYDDLLKDPQLTPLRQLIGHRTHNDLGITACTFHTTQPWLFTGGADYTIRLYGQ